MSELEHEVQRHSIMFLASSAGITLLGFLATMFYAHWVGADVLGQYFLFLSYFSILSLFTDLGMGYAITYRICEGEDPDKFFSAGIVLRMGLLILISLALVLFGDYFLGNFKDTALFWILIFVLGLSTLTSAVSTSLGASNRLGLAASVSLIDNVTRICVQVLAIFLGFKVYGLIGGLVAGLLVELAIDMKFVDYRLTWFDRSHVKKIFSFSSWAFLSTICTTLFDNVNLLIIAYFLTIADVGIFGICWTFSAFALFISTALCNTLFVKVSRWRAAGDWDAITIALSRATSYALILAIPMLIGGAILGERLLYYLYGSSFTAGATALVIIIGARVAQSAFQLYSNFLMATDQVRRQFFALLTGITANIILAVLLIPVWGLSGAAIASLVNVVISLIICRYYLGKVIPIHIEMKTMKDILISAGIMTAVLLPVSVILSRSLLATIAMVGLGAIVYLAGLFFLNSQIRDDVMKTLKIRWIS
jgi:O-antigen/teichoic acid export membrane protein